MLLAIDVGNTNITLAVFDGKRLVADWRVGAVARRTEDEYGVLFHSLFSRDGLSFSQIDNVAICSVVPATVFPLTKLAKRQFNIAEPLLISAKTVDWLEIQYMPRTDVGADRLANAVAAHDIYGGPAVVVDFGTATTFDAIGGDGSYLGGAIAPGIETSVEALVAKAAQLRRVEYVKPDSPVATTTVESLQSGVAYGFAGQVDRIVEEFRKVLGDEAKVIATGGLAGLIASESRTIQDVNQLLTLQGLRIISERKTGR